MPTIVKGSGLRVQIFPNDHRPPHVHVVGGGFHAVILIGDEGAAPEFFELRSGDDRLVRKALNLVAESQDLLVQKWKLIHGE